MSRSKKNWDNLISPSGNYIDLTKGLVGPKGPQGDPGLNGLKGNPGTGYKFKGELPTVGDLPVASPDTESFVYKITADDQFYASDGAGHWIVIPGVALLKGQKGELGLTGAQGLQGDTGLTGDTGLQGEPGTTGLGGATGDQGLQGIQGIQGIKGDPGPRGFRGPDGNDGNQGIQGDTGLQGEPGLDGTSAPTFKYMGEVASVAALPPNAEVGDVYKALAEAEYYAWNGTDWDLLAGVNSLKGDKGEKGQKGEKGVKGDKGPKGPKGDKGPKGEKGFKGEKVKGDKGDKGVKAEKGQKGEKGVKGEKGQKGEKGIKGDKGPKGTKGFWLDPDKYYDKGEVDNLLTGYPLKGDVYTKGEISVILTETYTKGEMDVVLQDYYTKGETYDQNYIDAKDDNRYTKSEVDDLLDANKGTTYTFEAVSAGPETNTANIILTNQNDNSQQTIPLVVTDEIGLQVSAGVIEIGSNYSQPLTYLGPITPPTDPTSLVAAPNDGNFFVYESAGTAWNTEPVEAGYWVIYDSTSGWQNILIGVGAGVTSVTVSGGVLSTEGSLSEPIIKLDKIELEDTLNDRYLRQDGSNNYEGPTLNLTNDGSRTNINNDTGINLCTDGLSRLTVNAEDVLVSETLIVASGKGIKFMGGSGIKLKLRPAEWGALSSDEDIQIKWGVDGVNILADLDMQANYINNIALLPISDDQAASKKYVDDRCESLTLTSATRSELGGVIVGDDLTITQNGTLSVDQDTLGLSFLKKTGGDMTGAIKLQETSLIMVGSAGDQFQLFPANSIQARLRVFRDKALNFTGYMDSDAEVRWMYWNGESDGLTIHYLADPVASQDPVNLRTLERMLGEGAGSGALATEAVAGTVKVNVSLSATTATDSVYRTNDGKLYAELAEVGTSTDINTGTQRGLAAFNTESFTANSGFIELKVATKTTLGGIKASASTGSTSDVIAIGSGGVARVIRNTNLTEGVSKRGEICVASTNPGVGDFTAGQMVYSTSTGSVYIRV